MAASYFTTFLFYLMVSVTEMVSWFVYLGGNGTFAAFYMGVVGYWGSIVLYMLPPLFALFHFAVPVSNGGISGALNAIDSGTDLFLLIVGGGLWITHMVLHIMYVPRFVKHVAAINYCNKCSLRADISVEATQSCLKKCPESQNPPPVDFGETDDNFSFLL